MWALARNPLTRGGRPSEHIISSTEGSSDLTRDSSRPPYFLSVFFSSESPPQVDGHEASVVHADNG